MRGVQRCTLVTGELNLQENPQTHVIRMDDFYEEKRATAGEIYGLLKEGDYACPLWDQKFFENNPEAECLVLTIQQVTNEGVPEGTKLTCKYSNTEVLKRYYSNMDPVATFLNAGVAGRENLSKVADNRDAIAEGEYNEFYQNAKNGSLRSASSSISCDRGMLGQLKLGYVIAENTQGYPIRGIAIPNFPVPELMIIFNYGMTVGRDRADEVFRGEVADLKLTCASAPDYQTAVMYSMENRNLTLPEFDPLAEKSPGMTDAQWHYWLRTRAKHCAD